MDGVIACLDKCADGVTAWVGNHTNGVTEWLIMVWMVTMSDVAVMRGEGVVGEGGGGRGAGLL